MSTLSWNEIKSRAVAFSNEWKDVHREEADAKEFLIEFLNVFGITKRRVSTFEHRVKKLDAGDGYIDLLWPGMLLVEMKSKGKDLEKAYKQAKEYCHGLKEYELPKMIMVSDFHDFVVYNEDGEKVNFTLPDLIKHIQVFAPLAGYQKRTYKEQDPVNIEAAERMGKLHDKLKEIGYDGHNLEVYLVRLLFCLFADDTGIFERGIFLDFIETKTKEDGSDLAAQISQLFQILNTDNPQRLKVLDEALNAFPYVNGKLFEENLPVAAFDSKMRKLLLDCCALDWSRISPAIFGSLFQSVMDEKARRNLGAHYTSEKNILKVIKPLFLDDLWKEYESVKNDKGKLKKLHEKISRLRFLDPACGCGNFLIIAYREIRLLELEIVKSLLKGQQVMSINDYFLVDVDQFYGIEYEEFPSHIAQVAMWLMDHQLNNIASQQFGEYFKRIPLKKSATIVYGNALRIEWQGLIDPMPWEKEPSRFHYIFGNPPFVGKHLQNKEQKADMAILFLNVKGAGVLDYVSGWYQKAAKYLVKYQAKENQFLPRTKIAFVSTNSISQGEQVGTLWNELFKYHIKIHFAYRSFKWSNEARNNAGVHVVIIGFSNFNIDNKKIYEYDFVSDTTHLLETTNINPYLVDGKDSYIVRRTNPICQVPRMVWGNKPVDGGNLIIEDSELSDFLKNEPKAIKFIKQLMGAEELLHNKKRWCLWLVNANPNEIKEMPLVMERIRATKQVRLQSSDLGARKLADTPYLFRDTLNPVNFIVIPEVSSEKRDYIPIAFLNENIIPTNRLQLIPDAEMWHFGVLTSIMHMTWTKYVCGRLESRYTYSNSVVYNNFPWPENPSQKQCETVEKAAQAVLDSRAQFPESSLGDLYDPNTMPPVLVKAHQALDKAVDQCYRSQPFQNESKRIEFLFELYEKYTAGMFGKEKGKK